MDEYTLRHFASMMMDKTRIKNYFEVMRRTIKPGDVVVDVGAGTGIFSLVACQMGASRVYAIEPNRWIDLGREFAVANGFADRITFISDFSTNITLPERADVLIADMRGHIPLFETNIASMFDARKRLLKPDGIMIPRRDEIYATFAENERLYRKQVAAPWDENNFRLNMQAALRFQVNTPIGEPIQLEDVALPAQHWATLEYGITERPNFSGDLQWVVETPRAAHFVCLWFDAFLDDEVRYSSAPGEGRAEVYGMLLLPLAQPVTLTPGDSVRLSLRADQIGGRYMFTWMTSITDASGASKANFRQNSLFAMPMKGLGKRAATYVPQRDENGDIAIFVLAAMDGQTSNQVIAKTVQDRFPHRFPTLETALRRVEQMVQSFAT